MERLVFKVVALMFAALLAINVFEAALQFAVLHLTRSISTRSF
jgi:hypothetical protein